MDKENCELKLVDEIILYYDARSKKHQITIPLSILKIIYRYAVIKPSRLGLYDLIAILTY